MNIDSGESDPRESALNYLWVTKKQKKRERPNAMKSLTWVTFNIACKGFLR